MKLKQIKTIAIEKGINPGRMNKAALIRAIQKAEGNFVCFGTADSGYCNRQDCLWIDDCLSLYVEK